jgi:hypothetical protein
LGSPAKVLGSLPITSTRIRVPGASLAMRVARVTPLYRQSKVTQGYAIILAMTKAAAAASAPTATVCQALRSGLRVVNRPLT